MKLREVLTNGYEAGDEDIMMKHFEGISLSETIRTNGLVSMISVVIETSAQLVLFIYGSYIVWLIYCLFAAIDCTYGSTDELFAPLSTFSPLTTGLHRTQYLVAKLCFCINSLKIPDI